MSEPAARSPAADGPERKPPVASAPRDRTEQGAGNVAAPLRLQRSIGNRAFCELVQRSLKVGAVDDPLESGADEVASRVLRDLEIRQRTGRTEDDRVGDQAEYKPGATTQAASPPPRVRRKPGSTESLQSAAMGADGGTLDSTASEAIASAKGAGQPMESALRRSMEDGFGADFGEVRVHRDAGSGEVARRLAARAFTHGSDIHFAPGAYRPETRAGRFTIAHELAHVIQQRGGASATLRRDALANQNIVLSNEHNKDVKKLGTKIKSLEKRSRSKRGISDQENDDLGELREKRLEIQRGDPVAEFRRIRKQSSKRRRRKAAAMLRGAPEAYATIEKAYEDQFHENFAEMMSAQFATDLRAKGADDRDFYYSLIESYPMFTGRVKAAYREVFGGQMESKAVAEAGTRAVSQALTGAALDEKTNFLGREFAEQDHVTSVGKGRFDIRYVPADGELFITVKMFYNFKDNDQFAPQYGDTAGKGLSKEQKRRFGSGGWTDELKNEFKQGTESAITSTWSRKFVMTCQKAGWEDVYAVPRFVIEEVPSKAEAHFQIDADKATVFARSGQEQKLSTGGNAWVKAEEQLATIRQFDIYDKLVDPSVHEYLHRAEAEHGENAYVLDRQRVERVVSGCVLNFNHGSASLDDVANNDASLRAVAKDLRTLALPSTLVHLHPLVVKGERAGDESAALAKQRSAATTTALKNLQVEQPLVKEEAAGAGATRASVSAAPESDQVKATFVRNWHNMSVAHEFGHMLGLTDEYNPSTAKELTERMVSGKILPEGTENAELGEGAKSKKDTFQHRHKEYGDLLGEAGLTAPAFGDPRTNDTTGTHHSTSIMSGGFEVLPQHLVTVWEALAAITSPTLGKSDWRIE